jgi:hypothetical protein
LRIANHVRKVIAGDRVALKSSEDQQHEFNGTVALSCSVPRFAGIQCALSPSSINPGGTATLTVSTSRTQLSLLPASRPWFYALCLPAGLVFAVFGFRSRDIFRHKLQLILLGGVILLIALFQAGCGGGGTQRQGSGGGTPIGTYNIMVTATSGVTQHSTSVSLTVN